MSLSVVALSSPQVLGSVFRNAYLSVRQDRVPAKPDVSWGSTGEDLKRKYVAAAEYFFQQLGVNNIHEHKMLVVMTPLYVNKDESTGEKTYDYDSGAAPALYRWHVKNRSRLTEEQSNTVLSLLELMEQLEHDMVVEKPSAEATAD